MNSGGLRKATSKAGLILKTYHVLLFFHRVGSSGDQETTVNWDTFLLEDNPIPGVLVQQTPPIRKQNG